MVWVCISTKNGQQFLGITSLSVLNRKVTSLIIPHLFRLDNMGDADGLSNVTTS